VGEHDEIATAPTLLGGERAGRYAEAIATFREGREYGVRHGDPCARRARAVDVRRHLLSIATRRGDLTRARAALDEVAKPAEAAGAWHGWVWRMRLDELRAEIALRAGEHDLAIDMATPARRASWR
jgi:hypothetical protein